jgi:hypothetical protein
MICHDPNFDIIDAAPLTIHQCPHCDYIVYNDSLVTEFSEASDIYSDDFRKGELWDDYPLITRCEKCHEIFWLNEDSTIAQVEWTQDISEEHRHVRQARSLSLHDLIDCADRKFYNSDDEEYYLRKRLLWRFNDRIRARLPLYVSSFEKRRWYENVYGLKAILNFDDYVDRLLMAEMERYLGNFKLCMEIMHSFPYVDMHWYIMRMLVNCNRCNTLVFKLT